MDDWCYDIHDAVAAADTAEPQAPEARVSDSALERVLRWVRWLEDAGVVEVVVVVRRKEKRNAYAGVS